MLGALAVAVPFGALAAGGAFDSGDSEPAIVTTPATTEAPAAAAPAAPARSATDVSALYERVSPGVVSVQTRTGAAGGTGSGFVLDADGYILTNEHVVDQADTVRVRFEEGGPVSARASSAPTRRAISPC